MDFVAPVVVGIVVLGAMFWAIFGESIKDSLRTKNFWDD